MKISEFVKNFIDKKVMNTAINQNAVSDYLKKELEIKDYVPFAEKRDLCARVLEVCNTKDDSGLVKVDSVSRYILFTIAIISKYTNLEFSSGEEEIDSLDEYDMLCQNNLLNPILDIIGGEYVTCNNMLNMMMDDIVSNNNTVENVVGTVLGKFSDSLDELVSALANKVESTDLDLSQVDIDKYTGLIEKLAQK